MAVSRVTSTREKDFPYRYEGVIGVGDRKKKYRAKPSQVSGFVFPRQKGRLEKKSVSVGKNDGKSIEKPTVQFSVYTRLGLCLAFNSSSRISEPVREAMRTFFFSTSASSAVCSSSVVNRILVCKLCGHTYASFTLIY